MEKVAGPGGLFFQAHDPVALGNWYQQHSGIALTPTSEGAPGEPAEFVTQRAPIFIQARSARR